MKSWDPYGALKLQGARHLLSPFPWQACDMAAVEGEGLALQHTMSVGLPEEARLDTGEWLASRAGHFTPVERAPRYFIL